MAQDTGVTEILFPKAVVNAFLVEADVLTLIDTGTPGAVKKIIAALRGKGHAPRDIGRILVTHRHADHAGNAAELARLTGAEVHVSPGDAPFLRDGIPQPLPRPATPLGRLMVPYVKAALPWRLEPVAVQETLTGGATVGPFRAIDTPGHTAGHVALLWAERGILFSADAAAHITGLGPHPVADEPDRARESFRRLAEEDFDTAYFGHGRAIRTRAASAFRSAA
ncbi:MAG: MBL fold metallo-hydrolase [Actinomycetota bacterium]|nr:MBL fold metallo-hydrolase [Actinomycetota bacterium]